MTQQWLRETQPPDFEVDGLPCARDGDLVPQLWETRLEWTVEYALAECQSLATQLWRYGEIYSKGAAANAQQQ